MGSSGGTLPQSSRRRASDDRVATGLRVSHLLNTADLEPPDLPPAGTLVVRRFHDPSPHNLQTDPNVLLPGAAWQRAVRTGLNESLRSAARPANGVVPLGANAVFFADQAELLACLAADLVSGVAHSLWWWRAVLRSLSSGTTAPLFIAWRREPRYVPAALAWLAERHLAVEVLRALTPAQAWSLLESVAQTFCLEALLTVLHSPIRSATRDFLFEERQRLEVAPGSARQPIAETHPLPPWKLVAPDAAIPEEIGRERAALLGVCLAIQASPPRVQSGWFAQAFSSWRNDVSSETRPSGKSAQQTRVEDDRQATASPLPPPTLAREAAAIRSGSTSMERDSAIGSKAPFRAESPRVAEGGDVAAAPAPPSPSTVASVSSSEVEPKPTTPERLEIEDRSLPAAHSPAAHEDWVSASPADRPTLDDTRPGGVPDAPTSAEPILPPVAETWFGDPIQTGIGGVLFLISMFKALRLPSALEESCGCELGLGSWELLELVARCLLGLHHSHLLYDPLWKALASLAGRHPGTQAGAGFTQASCYRLPPAWVELLPPASAVEARARGGRFEVWHPLGLLLSDCHSVAPAGAVRHGRSEWTGCAPLGLAPSRPLRRLLAFLMPYLRWRLASSLGFQHASDRHLSETVLMRPATVWITPTHVDLVLKLNQASGRVRMSGLDADPGWLPTFGRVVNFHYRTNNAS